MNQFQIAADIVPCALRTANAVNESPLDSGTMIALSGALSTAVSVHGETDRKAIIKAALNITQDFEQIADDFFTVLEEAPVLSDASHNKNYQEIADFILENRELDQEERFQLYAENAPAVKFWKGFRLACLCTVILGILFAVGAWLSDPERRKQIADTLRKIQKFLSVLWKTLTAVIKAVKFVIHQMTK